MTLKHDQRCPACGGAIIVWIDAMQEGGDGICPSPLRIAFRGPLDTQGLGTFETYICKACGFTEWYARGIDRLDERPDAGIRIIDARPPATGVPYRDGFRFSR